MAQSTERFFDQQLAQSRIKGEIVSKYFYAWGKNAVKNYSLPHHDRVMYIDLFSGPGEYKDGNRSTPLLVMDGVLREPEFRRWVQVAFNDANVELITCLERRIMSMAGVNELSYPPLFSNEKVGPHFSERFDKDTCPTFTFLDPLGYRALSRELVASTIKSFHCDGMFFFNYARVNRALAGGVKLKSTFLLFGEERARNLSDLVRPLNPRERERLIVSEFTTALQEVGVEHPLFFRIRHRSRNETSHYLVFAANHGLAHHMMKNIMAKYSTGNSQGVPDYSYDPSVKPLDIPIKQLGLGSLLPHDDVFAIEQVGQLDELIKDLLTRFAGMTLTVAQIYQTHHYGTPYIERNYREALLKLEEEGQIRVDTPVDQRPKRHGRPTLSSTRMITFGTT